MAVIGATIDPTLPIIEQMFITVVRMFVGHISAVNTYTTLNVHEMAVLANINENRTSIDISSGMNGVTIVENAVRRNIMNMSVLRFIRFSSGIAMKIPGISKATTRMKLVYRFMPGIFNALKLKP